MRLRLPPMPFKFQSPFVYSYRQGGAGGYVIRQEGDIPDERYRRPPAVEKVVWSADNFALGEHGIRPKLSDDGLVAWDAYRVDPARQHTPRTIQRVCVAELTVYGEAFYRRVEGTMMPMPLAYNIEYDDNNIPLFYNWQIPNLRIPAEEILHLYTILYPGQRRGIGISHHVLQLLEDRRQFARAVSLRAVKAALFSIYRKFASGGLYVDPESPKTQEDRKYTLNIDDNIIQDIDERDSLESINMGRDPIAAPDLDRLIHLAVAQHWGLSLQQVMGDYRDANFSAMHMAGLADAGVWRRYQGHCRVLTEEIYQKWPERPEFDRTFNGWYHPTFPHADPTKTATTNKILVEMKAKSIQEVIMEDGRDPDKVFAYIEEYEKRFAEKEEETAPPPPGGSDRDDDEGGDDNSGFRINWIGKRDE